jgi:hypothetical protein
MTDKKIFNVVDLPLASFAESLGLGGFVHDSANTYFTYFVYFSIISLGLATQPSLKFSTEASAEEARAENRDNKNVNKKLELLKVKIKEEKLRKKRLREGLPEVKTEVRQDRSMGLAPI